MGTLIAIVAFVQTYIETKNKPKRLTRVNQCRQKPLGENPGAFFVVGLKLNTIAGIFKE